jgi:hypothetical protein
MAGTRRLFHCEFCFRRFAVCRRRVGDDEISRRLSGRAADGLRGAVAVALVVGDKAEMAERRFYAEWSNRAAEPAAAVPQAAAPPPLYGSAMRRGPPSGHDVIGLFPEPGGQR